MQGYAGMPWTPDRRRDCEVAEALVGAREAAESASGVTASVTLARRTAQKRCNTDSLSVSGQIPSLCFPSTLLLSPLSPHHPPPSAPLPLPPRRLTQRTHTFPTSSSFVSHTPWAAASCSRLGRSTNAMYYPQQSPGIAHKLPSHHDQSAWARPHNFGPPPPSPGYPLYTNGNVPHMQHHLPSLQHHHQNSLTHYPSPPTNGNVNVNVHGQHVGMGQSPPGSTPNLLITPHWQQQLLKCEVSALTPRSMPPFPFSSSLPLVFFRSFIYSLVCSLFYRIR